MTKSAVVMTCSKSVVVEHRGQDVWWKVRMCVGVGSVSGLSSVVAGGGEAVGGEAGREEGEAGGEASGEAAGRESPVGALAGASTS